MGSDFTSLHHTQKTEVRRQKSGRYWVFDPRTEEQLLCGELEAPQNRIPLDGRGPRVVILD